MFLSSEPQTGLFSLNVTCTYRDCLPMDRPPCAFAILKQRKVNIFHAFGVQWLFPRAVVVTSLISFPELILADA